MTTAYLVSTALMGVFVLAVLGWIGRSRGWYHYSPSADRVALPPGDDLDAQFARLSGDPLALTAAFALLVVGAVGGVALYIGGPTEMRAAAGIAVALGGGLLLVGYLLFGVYLSATRRGHPRSLAVAESATVAGVLFLVAVTLQLVG
ncbi:hypothetical protein [Haloarcula nitratireducens]|uniref:Uncharacterized protein n=1 Tax=Haloarcula nitratireducens TaxID=2487749 RepID=A0AAW4PBY0_9EURY|nr:hypothetical protein [Halomicroarcula nitratireducens]MBX0295411.1 hypothetical protein [Halomicroarcula nitratireducens]